jgi:O-acetylhomoserine (thiol)-lyase
MMESQTKNNAAADTNGGSAPVDPRRLFEVGRKLSPRRKSTQATTVEELAAEQLAHYNIDPESSMGVRLTALCEKLYAAQYDIEELWTFSMRELGKLPRKDRISVFNAKKFLSFQIAKMLDTLGNPLRRSLQELRFSRASQLARGHYAPIDNVTAIFSANSVIARTATYIYACAEWIDDAFQGKEMSHEVYQRFLNPTAIALANHIVDIEAGPMAPDYMAWNFNSGMAGIDCVLSHLVGYEDIVLASRNVYGGTHQLLHDWFAKPGNLNVAVEWFDGTTGDDLTKKLDELKTKHADRLSRGRQIYVYLESPCNPHGYVLDVPALCKVAHANKLRVMLDSTVGTPFLNRPLQRDDPDERPDFVIHSYTKDLCGTGNAIAGVVIGRNEDMFIPKGDTMNGRNWDETMFWNVYYIKGAFLDADKAFEVLTGMKTLEMRMLTKCINTRILARFLASHPSINVNCNGVEGNWNHELAERVLFLGLAAPLFTIDMEKANIDRHIYQRFFDSLAPTFGHMVSLGQSNTVVLCPALTSHSELSAEALKEAGIAPTTLRIAVGDEDVRELIAHFIEAARAAIEPHYPGFCAQFPQPAAVDKMARDIYMDVHARYFDSRPTLVECQK